MADYEVLLRETVKDLGIVGDVVRVRPGFARNYLFPRKLATTATEENKRVVARKRAAWDQQQKELLADVRRRTEALSGVTVTTREKADASGHLYGSVGAGRISELLAAKGLKFAESAIRLERPLKSLGSHPVTVHVHGEHSAQVTVIVESDEPTAAAVVPEGPAQPN